MVPGLIRWEVGVALGGGGSPGGQAIESHFLLPYIVREGPSVGSAGEFGTAEGQVGADKPGASPTILTLDSYGTSNYFLILQDRKRAYGIN